MEKPKGPTAGYTTATCGWRALLLPQLNRQSLYVYGSEMAVEKECMRQLQSGVFVIHPFSPMRYSSLVPACLVPSYVTSDLLEDGS